MKNGLLIWNVILTLAAGYLLFNQFSSTKKTSADSKRTTADTLSIPKKDFRIAYFEMDSVEANYERVKEVNGQLSKKEDYINAEMNRLGGEYQQRLNYYQALESANKMTLEQKEEAMQTLKNMQDRINNRKQELEQDYMETKSRLFKALKSEIEDYLREYNSNRGYSYIFANEPGLFYFRDSAYNITDDVVKGLNITYRKKPK